MNDKKILLSALLMQLAFLVWQAFDLREISQPRPQREIREVEARLTNLLGAIKSRELSLGGSNEAGEPTLSHEIWRSRQLILPISALGRVSMRPYKQWEFKLTDDACQLLGLTAIQQERVDGLLEKVLAELIQIESASKQLIETEDGSQYYAIPPYRADALKIKEEFHDRLAEIVGANLALVLSEKSDYLLAGFGELEQQFAIEEDEEGQFLLTHRMFTPDGEETGSMIQSFDPDVAMSRFGHLLHASD